jgi:hypothetical protein
MLGWDVPFSKVSEHPICESLTCKVENLVAIVEDKDFPESLPPFLKTHFENPYLLEDLKESKCVWIYSDKEADLFSKCLVHLISLTEELKKDRITARDLGSKVIDLLAGKSIKKTTFYFSKALKTCKKNTHS